MLIIFSNVKFFLCFLFYLGRTQKLYVISVGVYYIKMLVVGLDLDAKLAL